MAEIEVEAAAAVLGMRVGQRASFENTPFLQSVITAGKLVDTSSAAAAEQVSRDRHPAYRGRAARVELVEADAALLGAAAELADDELGEQGGEQGEGA